MNRNFVVINDMEDVHEVKWMLLDTEEVAKVDVIGKEIVEGMHHHMIDLTDYVIEQEDKCTNWNMNHLVEC